MEWADKKAIMEDRKAEARKFVDALMKEDDRWKTAFFPSGSVMNMIRSKQTELNELFHKHYDGFHSYRGQTKVEYVTKKIVPRFPVWYIYHGDSNTYDEADGTELIKKIQQRLRDMKKKEREKSAKSEKATRSTTVAIVFPQEGVKHITLGKPHRDMKKNANRDRHVKQKTAHDMKKPTVDIQKTADPPAHLPAHDRKKTTISIPSSSTTTTPPSAAMAIENQQNSIQPEVVNSACQKEKRLIATNEELFDAVTSGNLSQCFTLLGSPRAAQMARFQNEKDETVLHQLFKHKEANDFLRFIQPLFQPLYNAYPEAAERVDIWGRLPLHVATENHLIDFAIIHFLVEKIPTSTSQYDGNGNLPIHNLCSHPSHCYWYLDDAWRELWVKTLSNLDKPQRTERNNLPIHCAAFNNNRFLDAIIKHDPDAIHRQNYLGELPIHLVRDDDLFLQLARRFPQTLLVQSRDGCTPLQTWYKRYKTPRSCKHETVAQQVVAIVEQTGQNNLASLNRVKAQLLQTTDYHKLAQEQVAQAHDEIRQLKTELKQEKKRSQTLREEVASLKNQAVLARPSAYVLSSSLRPDRAESSGGPDSKRRRLPG